MTTEWDDAQRRIGNLPALEKDVDVHEDIFSNFIIAEAEKIRTHANESLDQLDERIDNADEDEEDELQKIRRKRLAELMAKSRNERFGDCQEISKSQFISEVSEESKTNKVLVLIFTAQDRKGDLLQSMFARVAENCKTVKFLYMREEKRVNPMIVCYQNGEPTFTARPDVSSIREADELEWSLARQGMIKTELQEDPRLHSGGHRVNINIHRKSQAAYNEAA